MLAAVLLAGLATSCKKGEDDPLVSLRTRKARVTGEWKVTGIESTSTSDDGTTKVETSTTYDGSTATTTTVTTQSGGSPITTTGSNTFTVVYTFDKDGSYSCVREYIGNSSTETGSWSFILKSKENELKNKEAIMLVPQTITNSNGYTSQYEVSQGQVLVIKQLKNKEIVWTRNSSSTSPGNASVTDEETMTLTKQ